MGLPQHLTPSGEPCRYTVATFCDSCGWVLKEDHQDETSALSEVEQLRKRVAELEQTLASKGKALDDAVVRYLTEAHALQQEPGSTLRTLRRQFGPIIHVAWSMGNFFGPCAHGRDPYDRCDECESLTPLEAYERVRNERMASLERLLGQFLAETDTAATREEAERLLFDA